MERELRSVARYFLTPHLHAAVDGNPVKIVDLSTKGARLETVTPLEAGKTYYLIVSSDITIAVTALWSELDSLHMDFIHDTYLVGVAFDRPSRVIGALLDELEGSGRAMRIEDFRSCDRYMLTTPITASFGDASPVSLLDLSARGARIQSRQRIGAGAGASLRFQVDGEHGPIDVHARVVWAKPSDGGSFQAGLSILGQDELMRSAIQRLCIRGEARIDLDSLRRKFDAMRAAAAQRAVV